MDKQYGKHNVYLVGLMGAGKTTIGRSLAKRLALEFVDSPQARAHYAQRGTLAYPGSGPELAKTIVDDREQWKRLADLAGMQAQ